MIERLKDMQPLLLSFSIIVGGFWALYQFDARKEREIATAQLNKLNNGRAIQLDVSAEAIPQTSCLLVTVKISHLADKLVKIDMSKTTVFLQELQVPHRRFEPIYLEDSNNYFYLAGGMTKEIQALFEAQSAGIFEVYFSTPVDKNVVESIEKQDQNVDSELWWSDAKLVYLQETRFPLSPCGRPLHASP